MAQPVTRPPKDLGLDRLSDHMSGYDPSKAPTFVWPERTLRNANQAIQNIPEDGLLSSLGVVYARWGKHDPAREAVVELKHRAERHFVSPVVLAKICANLGDTEQAIAYLAKAYSLRDPSLMWLKTSRPLSALQSQERFKEIVRNMNFPP